MEGLAYVGHACKSESAAVVAIYENINIAASIVAHELGHLLFMYHDEGRLNPKTATLESNVKRTNENMSIISVPF